MTFVSAPIFVTDHGGLYVFDSIEDLVVQLEAVDVEDGLYRAYDKEGTLLRLIATGVRRQLRGLMVDQSKAVITVEPAEPVPTHKEELKRLIVEYLAKLGRDRAVLAAMDLGTLTSEARRTHLVRVKRSWLARWNDRKR